MMVGSTLKAKTKPVLPPAAAWAASGPNTNSEPIEERASEERALIFVAQPGEEPLPDGRLQDEQGERELEAEAPGHGARTDARSVARLSQRR